MKLLRFFKMMWSRLMDRIYGKKRSARIADKLERAYIKKIQDRRALKKKIEEHVEAKLKLRRTSEYIPAKLKREILETVYHDFGDEMKKVDLYLKADLEWNS